MNIYHVLERSQRVPHFLDEIFAFFFSNAENLEILLPPWLRFHIVTPQPVAMFVVARQWHHLHTFESCNGGTLLKDRVHCSRLFGIFEDFTHALSVRANLNTIFEYREEKVWELFGGAANPQLERL